MKLATLPHFFLFFTREREWKKHGSCSSLTIEQYFEKVIQLATLYNIYKYVINKQIEFLLLIH